MRVSVSGIVVALVKLHLVSAELHEVWWNITYTNANPDGLFDRQVIGINGSWPYVFYFLRSRGFDLIVDWQTSAD